MPEVLQGFHAAAKNMELPPLQTAATEVIYTLQEKKICCTRLQENEVATEAPPTQNQSCQKAWQLLKDPKMKHTGTNPFPRADFAALRKKG